MHYKMYIFNVCKVHLLILSHIHEFVIHPGCPRGLYYPDMSGKKRMFGHPYISSVRKVHIQTALNSLHAF